MTNLREQAKQLLDLERQIQHKEDDLKEMENGKPKNIGGDFSRFVFVCITAIAIAVIGFIMNKNQVTPPVIVLYPIYNLMKNYYGFFLIVAAVSAFLAYGEMQNRKYAKKYIKRTEEKADALERAIKQHDTLQKEMIKEKNKNAEASKYRFFFEVPFDVKVKEPKLTWDWSVQGELNLFKDGNKVGIQGFNSGVNCKFYQLLDYVGGEDVLRIYADTDYLQNHQEEEYTVRTIYRLRSLELTEDKTYATKPLHNIEKSMSDYVERLDSKERYLNGYFGNGQFTNEDLWNRGDISYVWHNYLSEQREKWLKDKKLGLEMENRSATQTVTYVTGIQSLFYSQGYAIYNNENELVFLALKRVPGVARIISYKFHKKIDYRRYKGREKEFQNNPIGEVIDFQVGYDDGANKFFLWQAMKYVVEKYAKDIPNVGVLDQRPIGMTDDEWRVWVMINYNHDRLKK